MSPISWESTLIYICVLILQPLHSLVIFILPWMSCEFSRVICTVVSRDFSHLLSSTTMSRSTKRELFLLYYSKIFFGYKNLSVIKTDCNLSLPNIFFVFWDGWEGVKLWYLSRREIRITLRRIDNIMEGLHYFGIIKSFLSASARDVFCVLNKTEHKFLKTKTKSS